MDDAVYLFKETSKSAKRLARGAYNKRTGSRSKKCSLPSDRLTPKQLKERNGEIMSYNLSKPMNWDTFKKLDDDTQRRYIYRLANSYHGRSRDVAVMFGITPVYFSNWLSRKSWGGEVFPHTGKRTAHSAWLDFLRSDSPKPEGVLEHVEEPSSDQTAPAEVKFATGDAGKDAKLIRGTLAYTGMPGAILNAAYNALDENSEYFICVTFTKMEHNKE